MSIKDVIFISGNSAGRNCLLGFFFVLTVMSCKAPRASKNVDGYLVSPPMIVTSIKQTREIMNYKVTFRDSARIYELMNRDKDKYLGLLEESMKNKTPVIIYRYGDADTFIQKVEKAP